MSASCEVKPHVPALPNQEDRDRFGSSLSCEGIKELRSDRRSVSNGPSPSRMSAASTDANRGSTIPPESSV